MRVRSIAAPLALALATWIGACAGGQGGTSSGEPGGELGNGGSGNTAQICDPYSKQACECMGSLAGTQICTADGLGWSTCDCSTGTAGGGGGDPCGDGICDDGEDCHTCKLDCGSCDPCDIAPSCDNAQIAPVDLSHMEQFDVNWLLYVSPEQLQERLASQIAQATDAMRVLAGALDPQARQGENPLVTKLREVFEKFPAEAQAVREELIAAGMRSLPDYRSDYPARILDAHTPRKPMDIEYPGGTMECGSPMLRVGIQKVKVHEADDPWPSEVDEIYCILQGEAQAGAEIRVTPLMTGLGNGDSHVLSNEAGVFWGQVGPTAPGSNLMLTYDCIENDDTQAYEDLIDSISDGATQVGGAVGGEYGWVFTTVGAVGGVVSTAMALNGDDKLFNAQQIIPLENQLQMTNGVWWSIRKGDDGTWEWDWELFVRAWGCAEYGTL